jgi:exosome complex component RRP40
MDPNNPFLHYLGKLFPFETAIGMNGRVWVSASTPKEIILAVNILKESETCDPTLAKEFIKSYVRQFELQFQ